MLKSKFILQGVVYKNLYIKIEVHGCKGFKYNYIRSIPSLRTLLEIPYTSLSFDLCVLFFILFEFGFFYLLSICALVGLNIMHHPSSCSMDLEDEKLSITILR